MKQKDNMRLNNFIVANIGFYFYPRTLGFFDAVLFFVIVFVLLRVLERKSMEYFPFCNNSKKQDMK